MKKLELKILACMLMLLFSFNKVHASVVNDLSDNNSTHTIQLSLEPEPLFSFENSYKVAEVHWLPDWQFGLNSRVDGGNPGVGGGDDHKCGQYSGVDSCTSPMEGTRFEPFSGLVCYRDCKCPARFQYTTSTNCRPEDGKVIGTTFCGGKSDVCSCGVTVTIGVGEECKQTCDGNCTKKECKAITFNTNTQECDKKCVSNNTICATAKCKVSGQVSVAGNSEECVSGYSCPTDSSKCYRKQCKSSGQISYDSSTEKCTVKCPTDATKCYAKACLDKVTYDAVSEQCTLTCKSDGNWCIKADCKSGYGKFCDASGKEVRVETDCSVLGYTDTAGDCTDKKKLYCPFDKSKFVCY